VRGERDGLRHSEREMGYSGGQLLGGGSTQKDMGCHSGERKEKDKKRRRDRERESD